MNIHLMIGNIISLVMINSNIIRINNGNLTSIPKQYSMNIIGYFCLGKHILINGSIMMNSDKIIT